MPCVQRFSVGCFEMERCHLVPKKTPLFGNIDVLKPCKGYFVQIDDMVL